MKVIKIEIVSGKNSSTCRFSRNPLTSQRRSTHFMTRNLTSLRSLLSFKYHQPTWPHHHTNSTSKCIGFFWYLKQTLCQPNIFFRNNCELSIVDTALLESCIWWGWTSPWLWARHMQRRRDYKIIGSAVSGNISRDSSDSFNINREPGWNGTQPKFVLILATK